MSDWNSKYDPGRRDMGLDDPDTRTAKPAWGWIAAAVFAIAALRGIIGVAHAPGPRETRTASNQAPPPATSPMGGPITTRSPAATNPAAPIMPTPNAGGAGERATVGVGIGRVMAAFLQSGNGSDVACSVVRTAKRSGTLVSPPWGLRALNPRGAPFLRTCAFANLVSNAPVLLNSPFNFKIVSGRSVLFGVSVNRRVTIWRTPAHERILHSR